MKSLMKIPLRITIILAVAVIFIRCNKEAHTLAKIKVVNSNLENVPNAEVKLMANPDSVLNQMIPADIGITDAEGWIIFDYTEDFKLGQAGFRVLDIEANSGDTIFGTGIIKIVEKEENVVTVVVTAP